MLPEENRLQKNKDFERVFKKGKGFKEDFLFLKVVENGLERIRFGFIISKDVSKKAIVRNKIKRQLRNIVQAELPRVKQGFDVALVVLPGLEKKEFKELEEIIDRIFAKAKIYLITK